MPGVRKRYEGAVRQDVLGQAIEQAFYRAVAQENLRPVGQPNIEPVNMEAGKDLEFVATFEVFPEVELADLSGVEVEQAESKVMAADVKKMIENLREQKEEWKKAPAPRLKKAIASPLISWARSTAKLLTAALPKIKRLKLVQVR